LLLTRGEFPKNISDDQGKLFGEKAGKIIKQYELKPIEGQGLRLVFTQLIDQWIVSGADYN